MKAQTRKHLLAVLSLVFVFMVAMLSAGITMQTASATVSKGSGSDTNILMIDSFKMVPGASVRVGDGSEEQMGIRFSGELSVSDYIDLTNMFNGEGDTIDAGTLIMPYSYLMHGQLNYDDVFGDSPKFYWGNEALTPGENPTGMKRIQNVDNALIFAYKEVIDEVETIVSYRINGSITKYQNKNLDRELVAVSYIKATDASENKTYYAFANTDYEANKRSIITASQNGLINGGQDGEFASTYNDYIDRYVSYYQENNGGQSPEFSYTEEVYLYKSTGFVKVSEEVKKAEYVSGNVVVGEVPEKDGWNYLAGQNCEGQGQATDILRPDDSAKVKYYFEEDRDNVLFSCDGLEGTDPAAVEAFKSNNNVSSTNGFGSSSSPQWTKLTAKSLHRSQFGIVGQFMAENYFGITFAQAIKLPTPTKTFSFIGASSVAGAVSVSVNGKSGIVQFEADANLTPKKYTVTLSTEIESVSDVKFITYGASGEPLYNYNSTLRNKPYYFDNFCWESELYNTAGAVGNIMVESAETKSVTVPVKLQSTVCSQDEMESIKNSITATYTCMPNGTATAMSLGEEGYIIPVEKERNYKYTVQSTELDIGFEGYVLGYFENVFATFEQEDGGDGHTYINGMDATKYPDTVDVKFTNGTSDSKVHTNPHPSGTPGCDARITSEVGSVDGSYTLRSRPVNSWLGVSYAISASAAIKSEGVSYGLNTTKACTTVCFFVYSATASDVSVRVQCVGHTAKDLSSRTVIEVDITIKNGWNYVELDFSSPVYSMYSFLLLAIDGNAGFRYLDHITLR